MRLKKHSGNPILTPNSQNTWEELVVCNPGAWREDRTVYLLYRAAGNDPEHKIYFGLATSDDGYNFKRAFNQPVLAPSNDGYDAGCVEDPRIVKMGEHFFVTYAFRHFPPGRYWEKEGFEPERPCLAIPELPEFVRNNLTMSGLLVSKDLKAFDRVGTLTSPNIDDRDVILFPEKVGGRFVMLHRPYWVGSKYGCNRPSIWISFADDLLGWKEHHLLAQPKCDWESKKIGGAAPPIKTDEGWLLLYHGVDEDNVYRTGVMLLDLENPLKIIARARDFIMEPEHGYETNGIMPCGIVFPTGNVVIDDELFVYYGAADKYIGVATVRLRDLVKFVLEYPNKE